MNWGEFKEWVELQGVQPNDEIDYIDILGRDVDKLKIDRYGAGPDKIFFNVQDWED